MVTILELIERQAIEAKAQRDPVAEPRNYEEGWVEPRSRERTLILPATLAGRCANGYERGAGRVVHAVQASPYEKELGIESYANSLCGKTHGARSAGWSHNSALTITCPKCIKALAKARQ